LAPHNGRSHLERPFSVANPSYSAIISRQLSPLGPTSKPRRRHRPAALDRIVMERFVSPEDQGGDQALALTLRPKRLKDYIGQEKVKQNLDILIDAARARGEALDHILLYGPPGLGKTTLATIIANEMDASIKITSGPAITIPGDLASTLTSLQAGDVLFIDEVHPPNRLLQQSL